MWRKIKERFSTQHSKGVAFVVSLNFATIILANIYDPRLYWLLLLTIPVTLLMIDQIRKSNTLVKFPLSESRAANFPPHELNIRENDWTVEIGNEQCSLPYTSDVLTVELIPNRNTNKFPDSSLIRRLPTDVCAVSQGGELQTYNIAGKDLVLRIVSADDGWNSVDRVQKMVFLKRAASLPEVKMIELDLSSQSQNLSTCNSPTQFVENNFDLREGKFSRGVAADAESILHSLDNIRGHSLGKPVGIRLSIGAKKEFYHLCHAMRKTGIVPDFIMAESLLQGHTPIINDLYVDHNVSIYQVLLFIKQTLLSYGLEKQTKVLATANSFSNFDILNLLAVGANVVFVRIPNKTAQKFLSHACDQKAYETLSAHDIHNLVRSTIIRKVNSLGFSGPADITIPNLLNGLRSLNLDLYKNFDGLAFHRNSKIGSGLKLSSSKMKAKETRSNHSIPGLFTHTTQQTKKNIV